ncbi:MAG: hypothetical protein NTY84_04910 [Verrucomicrobia bacterium]|nr:hypothetical protein [Verrucomicrobiota bacterium]
MRRTVNPNRDRDEPEMLEMQAMLEMLEMLDRHGSRTGTLFASSPGLTLFRASALPVKGLKLVVEKRRLCGDLSPELAFAVLQKTPPDALWTHDPPQGITTIYSPFAGTIFLELHYVKSLKNSAGPLSVRKN